MSVFSGRRAALATLHGKEAVIAPILARRLGLDVDVVRTVDTDRFGTFTGEVPRRGDARTTAREKALAAIAAHGAAELGIASEGSFGPHPQVPFAACGCELVVLVDAVSGLELLGVDVTPETNFASASVASVDEALEHARAAGFPTHGMIVRTSRGNVKGILDEAWLRRVVDEELRVRPRVTIETDMRAHMNPTRQRAIARATEDLARAAASECPTCGRPGFVVVERIPGLRCEECGAPTARPRAERIACAGCGHTEERPLVAPDARASPHACDVCNP